MDESLIFDRLAVRLHRDRAAAPGGIDAVADIMQDSAARLLDRLDDRHPTLRAGARRRWSWRDGAAAPGPAVSPPYPATLSARMAARSPGLAVAADEEWLPFAPASFDLVVANLSLHWVNDLPGALIQLRRALRPDGLFLAALPILPTLGPLRTALLGAEVALAGGASPRISPFPELRDCAALLQRAGFALPVVDGELLALRLPNAARPAARLARRRRGQRRPAARPSAAAARPVRRGAEQPPGRGGRYHRDAAAPGDDDRLGALARPAEASASRPVHRLAGGRP